MKKTGMDVFSTSPFVRGIAVVVWFVITSMAFFSRYEKMTPVLATLMASLIILIGTIGLAWAVFPVIQAREAERSKKRRPGI